jgi:hypothetical protein
MFEEILARIGVGLARHRIPYIIIGGQAVLLYGEPRLTRDIDITLTIDRINEFLAIVKELSLKPLPEDIEAFVRQTMVLPAFFFKQWGGWGADGKKRAKKQNGRLLEGRTWDVVLKVESIS